MKTLSALVAATLSIGLSACATVERPSRTEAPKPADPLSATVSDLEKAVASRQRLWQMSVKRGERVLQLQVPG